MIIHTCTYPDRVTITYLYYEIGPVNSYDTEYRCTITLHTLVSPVDASQIHIFPSPAEHKPNSPLEEISTQWIYKIAQVNIQLLYY